MRIKGEANKTETEKQNKRIGETEHWFFETS